MAMIAGSWESQLKTVSFFAMCCSAMTRANATSRAQPRSLFPRVLP